MMNQSRIYKGMYLHPAKASMLNIKCYVFKVWIGFFLFGPQNSKPLRISLLSSTLENYCLENGCCMFLCTQVQNIMNSLTPQYMLNVRHPVQGSLFRISFHGVSECTLHTNKCQMVHTIQKSRTTTKNIRQLNEDPFAIHFNQIVDDFKVMISF